MSELVIALFVSVATITLMVLVCAYANRRLRAFEKLSAAIVIPTGKLKLALSAYPDALLIDYIIKRSARIQDFVEIVPVKWSAIESGLTSNAFDIAYGNKSVFGLLVGPRGRARTLNIGAHLLYYDGFAVMANANDQNLNNVFRFNSGGSRTEISSILIALNQKRLAVSDATDHLFVMSRLFTAYDINLRPETIQIYESPGAALAAFLNGSTDAFVGGVTERLIARAEGAKEILRQDFYDLGQREINCWAYYPGDKLHLNRFVMNRPFNSEVQRADFWR